VDNSDVDRAANAIREFAGEDVTQVEALYLAQFLGLTEEDRRAVAQRFGHASDGQDEDDDARYVPVRQPRHPWPNRYGR
jgi:hypothetical protein